MGQGLSIGIDDSSNQCLCKVDIKPWLFSKRRGSKSLEAYSSKIDIYWDFSSAKFGSGPEPVDGYYVGIMVNRQMILLLGDMKKEAFKKTSASPASSNAGCIARREHIFGKKVFTTKARFCNDGQVHDLVIECDTVGVNDPCLIVRVDSKTVMQVKRLRWKFRGNHTILVDGLAVEVFWDVHNWLFGSSPGSAVFMFKTCLSAEKLWSGQPQSDPSALQWSFSQRFSDSKSHGLGYSLMLFSKPPLPIHHLLQGRCSQNLQSNTTVSDADANQSLLPLFARTKTASPSPRTSLSASPSLDVVIEPTVRVLRRLTSKP
ncbi:hypothetical protein ACLB2K_064816 [Fragaria x ananassa]